MKITDNLNPQQLAAVTAEDQHLLVIAGAGSGKTRVLVSRVAWLMAEKGVSPREIMAVTFTNKAANEMKERIEAMTGQPAGRMWIGTFHSLCARLLRIEAESLDLAPNFIIYDDSDCKRLMKDIIAELALPDSDKRYAPAAILFAISEAKNRLQSAAEYAADAADEWQRNIARAYRLYQQKLKMNGALDFDDLLVKGVQLLDTCPEVREKYQQRFRHILVDEYQDTNRCQYRLVQLLAGKSGNLFVVGDPDQSIYRWRGADVNNILDFTDDYPRCREIQLNRNYRSTQNILDVANSVIAHNKRRKEKRLDTENGSGERVIFRFSETDREEAAFVIRTIARLVEQGDYRYADCAVLYRTHGLSRLFEDECTRFHIPYRVYGGMKFYDRKEVRDLYAYLRLAANPNDAEALQRIYNVPRRGIGATTWQKVQEAAAASGQPLYAVLAQAAQLEGVSAATAKKLTSLHQLLASFAEFAAADATISDLLEKIWQESGYHDMLREQENYQEKLEIIEQLFDVAADFDASWAEMQALMEEGEFDTPLSAFLSQLALATDMDDEHQAESFVTLMTMHAAKGLEYPVVFIVGMEEGGFPHERALTGVDDSEMEEERRLCYVAMTRAKERLFLSAAGRRLIWGSLQNRLVSSFIDEVGEGLLDKQGFITRARAEQSVEKRREVQTSIFTGRTYGSSGGSRPAAPAPTPARPAASAPQPAAKPAAPAAPIALGDKVLHGKFGEGTVVAVQGSGDDLMVTVAFPGQGIKTLMWRFAPMKKI